MIQHISRVGIAWFVVGCCVVLIGAREVTRNIWALEDGTTLQDRLGNDSVVVAIYDPAACMACDNLLPDWFRWAKTHPNRFQLVLSREPTPREREEIALRRVKPTGVLRRTFGRKPWNDGNVFYALFVNRRALWTEPSSASAVPASLQALATEWLEPKVDGNR
jgi:hypothetical protein